MDVDVVHLFVAVVMLAVEAADVAASTTAGEAAMMVPEAAGVAAAMSAEEATMVDVVAVALEVVVLLQGTCLEPPL